MNWLDEVNESNEDRETWLKWREKGIGSSDIPIILELSPFKTKYQLWLEKSGQVKDNFQGNWATRRGQELEPVVRDWVNDKLRTNFQPENAIHKDNEIFRASADGVDHDAKMILEIKCPSKADHETAKSGSVPDKYYPQCQWLMMIFDYKILQYASYNEDYAIVTMYADQVYQEFMKKEAIEFWSHVKDKTIPDCKEDIITSDSVKTALDTYMEYKKKEKDLKKKLDELSSSISAMVTSKKAICDNYSLEWVTKKGNVDYSKIPELENVDLDKYRKEDSVYFKITQKKK